MDCSMVSRWRAWLFPQMNLFEQSLTWVKDQRTMTAFVNKSCVNGSVGTDMGLIKGNPSHALALS
ncbi:hypothetical protein SCA6_014976 [Theobroma cacao]